MQFDIIAISETWTDPDLIDDFNINNHDAYQVTRGIRRGGGAAIYTNKELSCKMEKTKSIAVDNILERATVEITIMKPHKVVFSCVYITPESNLDSFLAVDIMVT